jgi:prepilin-type N-terminal cleavage/methylation domain-containing protein
MRAPNRNGYTLAEMLIVCAVLAVAAAVALPSAQPVAEFRADAVTSEVVSALRFAREEAMRTGAIRMLRCEPAQNRVSVYIPDANGGKAATVNHPLTQMDYTVVLEAAPSPSNVTLSGCAFIFLDKKGTTTTTIAFDGNGNPVLGTGDAKTQILALSSGRISLGAGATQRTIAVDATGRVTTS